MARRALVVALIAGLAAVTAYLTVRLASIVATQDSVVDAVVGALLLAAELFVGLHSIGYLTAMLKSMGQPAPRVLARYSDAPVAVLLTSFNESAEVLEETLASIRAMDYPSFHIYMLDDSTREGCVETCRALAARYGATLVHRTNRAGFKAGAINDLLPSLGETYIAVLDADQRPVQSWLKEIVPLLEENPRLAFVQTPQFYVNTAGLPVANAACHQQAVFYEYICEGKSQSNAMFCCGSNVVLRREALLSVEVREGGRRHFFDETSVTEDFATSLRLHAGGWDTAYVNHTYVVGMGPETLQAYFTQQMRWAMGTLGIFLRMVRRFVRAPRSLAAGQWWEYLLSGSYYLVGVANLIYMVAAWAFLLAGIRPVRMDAAVYLMLFIPYFLFTMGVFLAGMARRGYTLRDIWLGAALGFGTSWIFLKAALVALFGLKRAFGVTPKGVGGRIPLRGLAPQVAMFALSVAAALTGAAEIAAGHTEVPYLVTTFWAAYHATLVGTLLFYFNRAVTIPERRLLFQRAEAA